MQWWDDLSLRALGSPKWRIIRATIVVVAVIAFIAIVCTDWYGVITGVYDTPY